MGGPQKGSMRWTRHRSKNPLTVLTILCMNRRTRDDELVPVRCDSNCEIPCFIRHLVFFCDELQTIGANHGDGDSHTQSLFTFLANGLDKE